MIEKPRKRTKYAAQKISAELRRRIAEEVYPANSYLPSMRELAEEFGAGLHTVSAALRQLSAQRLTTQAAGRGARVLPLGGQLNRGLVGLIHFPPSSEMVTTGLFRMVEAIQDRLARLGYKFEVVNGFKNPLSLNEMMAKYGAVVSVGHILHLSLEEHQELERRKFPAVIANLEPDWDITSTFVDHYKTTLQAMRLLVGMGHRRIGLVTRPSTAFFFARAREGYFAGLAEAGIPADETLVVESPAPENLSAYLVARQLVALEQPPTAIVATHDYLAHGAYQAFADAGFKVGRDVSLVGFDDVTWPGGSDFLTTFVAPHKQLGAVAVDMLSDRIVNGWKPRERREIEAPLVLRRTVAPFMPAAEAAASPVEVNADVVQARV